MKVWLDREILNNEDLNDNFAFLNRLITENEADGEVTGGFSGSVEEMQETISPGDLGSESLSGSLRGEILRIRYQLNEIIGKQFWYQRPSISLEALAANFGLQGSSSGVISGASRDNGFPLFIRHGATGLDITLDTSTPFSAIIKGRSFIQTTNLSTTLLAPPSTQNTATLEGQILKHFGERKMYGAPIYPPVFDAFGTNVSNRVDSSICLQFGSEPIFGYIVSATGSKIAMTDAKRGWFFDSSGAPIKPAIHADNAVGTLLSMSWIFYRNNGSDPASIFASYIEPSFSAVAPTTPSFGQMWFDTVNQLWKRFDGAVFSDYDCIFIGYACNNASNVVGTRSVEYFSAFSQDLSFSLGKTSTGDFMTVGRGSSVSVYGSQVSFGYLGQKVPLTSVEPGNPALSPSTQYYVYVDRTGNIFFSDVSPNFRPDMKGMYHPFAVARCVGWIVTDAGPGLSIVEASTSMPNVSFTSKDALQTTTSLSAVQVTGANPILWITEETSIDALFERYVATRPYFSSSASTPSASGSAYFISLTDRISGDNTQLPDRMFAMFTNEAINKTLYQPLSTMNHYSLVVAPGLYQLGLFMRSEDAAITTAASQLIASLQENSAETY